MKSIVLAALLGVASCVSIPDNQLVRINTSAFADSKALGDDDAKDAGSDDDEESDEPEEEVKGIWMISATLVAKINVDCIVCRRGSRFVVDIEWSVMGS